MRPLWLTLFAPLISSAASAMSLSTTMVYPGASLTVQVSGAPAQATVYFVVGHGGVGQGSCLPALGGRCVGVVGPYQVLGTARADRQGRARLQTTAPADIPGEYLAMQAAFLAGPVLSNVVEGPVDHDFDGWADYADLCPRDGNKQDPGACGCGQLDLDANLNGQADCLDAIPYPERSVWEIKAIQPDFWPSHDEISGNLAGGIAVNLVWAEWEPAAQAPPCAGHQEEYGGRCFNINAAWDDTIRDYTDRGLVVTGVLYGVPAWARISACSPVAPGFEIFCAPANSADYGRFVGMIARRYDGRHGHGRVADFVIHNEVNANDWYDVGCGQGLGACDTNTWLDRYAADWNAAYDAVRAEQDTGKVFISLEHHFDARWDTPGAVNPLLSGQTFLSGFAARVGARVWRVAYHPYAPNLFSPDFSADDLSRDGKVTYGSVGGLAGWLYQRFGDIPAARDIHFTESGLNSAAPQSDEPRQDAALCTSFRNILGTPGVRSHVYHRMSDNAAEGGLLLGLRRLDGTAKPAWSTWALMNRVDLPVPLLSCGFEDVPFTRLVRSYHPTRGHWASSRRAPSGFTAEYQWLLQRDPEPGTHQLYECQVGDHNLLSLSPSCEGQLALGPVGWAWDAYAPGRQRLQRCRAGLGTDHFVSTDPGCEGQNVEELLGWTL
jgi:hypothetical protein